MKTDTNRTDSENEFSCFGSAELHADIAGTFLFDHAIDVQNINELSLCKHKNNSIKEEEYTNVQPIFSIEDELEVSDTTEMLNLAIDEICAEVIYPFIIYDTGVYKTTEQQCQSIGGRLLNPADVTQEIIQISVGVNQTCIKPDDGIVSWVHTNETFEKINFHECKALKKDGNIIDAACAKYIPCSICLVKNVRATLYGHNGNYFDHVFHLSISNGEGIWMGRQGSTIVRRGSNWLLTSPLHQTQLTLSNQSLPIGRRIWNSSFSDGGMQDRLLAFSRCTTFEFSCNDGTCLDINFRCDDIFQCKDLSDEVNCNVVKLSASYNEFYEPPPRPGEKIPTKLFYEAEVYHMGTITTDEGRAKIDLGITVSWYDPRLDFSNLKLGRKNFFPCEQVWKPSIRALTGRGDGSVLDTKTYEEQCYTTPKYQEPSRSMDDPWMSEYSFEKNILVSFINYISNSNLS